MSTELQYPLPTPPELGEAQEIAPGVFWLRLPLPFVLNHVNVWLLADGDGWTLVDTGLKSSKIEALWRQIMSDHFGGKPLKRIIGTHFHPDHIGLAGWFEEHWQVPLWMTRLDWSMGRMLQLDSRQNLPQPVIDHFDRIGLSQAQVAEMEAMGYANFGNRISPIPMTFRRISHGEEITIGNHIWRVVVGRGHTPEQACLYCDELGLLISGDQILPRITPMIGVYPSEPDANPLLEFLHSLDRFKGLPANTLVLPSHDNPFVGVGPRIDTIRQHHRDRLDDIYGACIEPKTLRQTVPYMFDREFTDGEIFMAVAEGLAHANYLIDEVQLDREMGADGAYRYRQAGKRAAAA